LAATKIEAVVTSTHNADTVKNNNVLPLLGTR
jgi:hypothetical protein